MKDNQKSQKKEQSKNNQPNSYNDLPVEFTANKYKKKSSLEFVKTFFIESIPLTFLSIWRNKRRSFAILSGILLAMTLLSGIILYNNELKRNNYASLITDQPYEVQFVVMGNASDTALQDITAQIKIDQRVAAITTIGASSSGFQSRNQIRSSIKLPDDTGTITNPTPIFVDNSFMNSEIGAKLLNMDFEGSSNLIGDSIIIPIQLARDLNLEIGDKISLINLTQTIQSGNPVPGGGSGTTTTVEGKLFNLTIIGTYKANIQESFSLTTIFSSSIFSGENIFISMDALKQKDEMNALETSMRLNGNLIIAVKLDAAQFSVDDVETFSQEIDQFINQITRNSAYDIQGENVVATPLMGFQIISTFTTILYIVLSLPVIFLSIYLLNFGLEMSLEERRRDIAIKKMQGANSTQIFGELRNETILMLVMGSIIGYLFGILSAWLISSATGYMQLSIGTSTDLLDYLYFDTAAFLYPLIITSLLLISQIYKKGRSFINSEITEGVSRREIVNESFFKKNYLDVVFFAVGLVGIGVILINELNIPIYISSLYQGIIFMITPFTFWIGGSSVGSRLTKWIPLKLENSFLKLGIFKDTKRVIKGGLKRRGDMDRLALIIILTLSIASLATIQGTTEENQAQRKLEWEIGADWLVTYNQPGVYSQNLTQITGFNDSLGIYKASVKIYSSSVNVMAIDNSKELANLKSNQPVIHWQTDNFDHYDAINGLQLLDNNPRGIFLTEDQLTIIDATIGDTLEIKVPIKNATSGETIKLEDVTIVGIVNQLPGGISSTMLTSLQIMREITAASLNLSINAFEDSELNATQFFVRSAKGDQITAQEIEDIQLTLDGMTGIKSERSYYYEKAKINTTSQGYGVTGLLSLDFIISLIAAIITAFAFSAILMERRKHEFAIFRAIGAKKKHIYKLALGENILMMLTASLWGIFLGTGIAYLFNGVFVFVSMFTGSTTSFERLVMIPTLELIVICSITFIGMLIAALLSIRSSANQDLAMGVKEV